MNKEENFEKLLQDAMDVEQSGIDTPDPKLVFAARQMIGLRKKENSEKRNYLLDLVYFLKTELRFYHLGLSVMLIFGGFFYITEPRYNGPHASALTSSDEVLSLKNSTISVNSSTMLTSIPTLRY